MMSQAEPLKVVEPGQKLRTIVLTCDMFGRRLFEGLETCPEVIDIVGMVPVSLTKRGAHLAETDNERWILDYVQSKGIPIIQTHSVNSPQFYQTLESVRPDIILVAAWPQIIKPHVLAVEGLTVVNCHGSLLPKYRGACPFIAALYYGDSETGVTFQRMDEGVDTGDILHQETVPILPTDNSVVLSYRIADRIRDIMPSFLEQLAAGVVVPRPQVGEPSYVPMYQPEWGWIQWHQTPETIARRIRALDQFVHHFTTLYNVVIGFQSGHLIGAESPESALLAAPGNASAVPIKVNVPGLVISHSPAGIRVSTRDPEWHLMLQGAYVPHHPPDQSAQLIRSIMPGHQFVSPLWDDILRPV